MPEILARAGVLGIALVAVAACQTPVIQKTAPRSTVFEGVEIELRETVDDTVLTHPNDRDGEHRTKYVDVDSKLRLSFTPPPDTAGLEANPEWQALENAISVFETMQVRYLELVARAAELPEVADDGTEAWQQELREFRRFQSSVLFEFVGKEQAPGIATREEVLAAITAGGAEGGNPYAEIARLINDKQEKLRGRIRDFANAGGKYEVTVRATIDPQVGKRQQIQIPGYFTIDDRTGSLESHNVKRAAQFRKLRAEHLAASDLAASVREIQANRDTIEARLQSFLDEAGANLKATGDRLAAALDGWPERLAADVEAGQGDTASRIQLALERLQADIELARELAGQVQDLVRAIEAVDVTALLGLGGGDDIYRRFDTITTTIAVLERRILGLDGETGWEALIDSLVGDIARATAAGLNAEADAAMRELGDTLQRDVAAARDELTASLPLTQDVVGRIIGTFEGNGRFLVAVDEIEPSTGTEIPHRFGGDLPDAIVDLGRSPLTHGDDLTLSLSIWPLDGLDGSRLPEAEPVETFNYTFDAINEGWVWSGDLVFTMPEDDNFGDKFDANAAVSREWRFYNRVRSESQVNWWRPGLGFHAVQLNQDPDTSAEVGIGFNASLWGGLLRFGYGYNLSIDGTPEYWFLGFGVASALNQISDLSNFRN